MAQSARNNNFSLLRIAAALMVISGHMAYFTATPLPTFLNKPVHELGVAIFFLMGGYLITQSWLSDPKPIRYAAKRFFRIWPALAVFVLIAAFVIGPFFSYLSVKEYYVHPFTWQYLKNMAFYIQYSLPGVFAENPYPNAVNGSLWTLPVEVAMYVMVPCILTVLKIRKQDTKKTAWWILAGVVAVVCGAKWIVQVYYPTARWVFYATDWIQALHVVPYYFIGMLYAAPGLKKILNLPLACFLMLGASCFYLSEANKTILFYLLLPYFVFSVAFAPANRLSAFFDKYEISYGLYLYGFFVQQIIVIVTINAGVHLSPSIYTVLCTAVTAVMAFFSYKFVEQPFANLCKKVLEKLPK